MPSKDYSYSVAVVNKYNMVKLFLCSFKEFDQLQHLTEQMYADKVLNHAGDEADCKFRIQEDQVKENEWMIAGEISTKEKCFTMGRNTFLYQSLEVHIIKSLYSPHRNLPPIKVWCSTCVQRPSSGVINYPRQEAQTLLERVDVELKSRKNLRLGTQFRPKSPNSLPQKLGKTKYDVKLIHISTGYKI